MKDIIESVSKRVKDAFKVSEALIERVDRLGDPERLDSSNHPTKEDKCATKSNSKKKQAGQ
jgi:hypothetical protein